MVGITRKDTPAQDAPSLEQRLESARQAASTARAHLDGVKARMTAAVKEARYGDAEDLQQQLPDAEHAWAVAAAEQRGIEGVLEHLARERHEHEVALQAERRKNAATGVLNAAVERERAGMDELQQVRAEITAGVAAVKDAIERGRQLEIVVRQARADQGQARVDSGEAQSAPAYVTAPNNVSAWVDRSPALLAIARGQALP